MLKLLIGWMAAPAGFGIRERGASLIEYVLIIAVVAIAVFVGANLGLGEAISDIFEGASDCLKNEGDC